MRLTFPLLFASLLLVCGCNKRSEAPLPTQRVATVKVTPQNVGNALPVSGVIEAVDKAQLGFMVAGRILAMEVEDGATVTAGQLLARLDAADYRQELAIAEAKLAEARARHARLSRMRELGSLTATDFDQITTALRQAESAAQLSRQRVGYTEMHAPFAGRVTRHAVAVGMVVAPGMPVWTVLAPAPVWATLSVAEVDTPHIAPGQPVHVVLAATEAIEADGLVEAILPQADPVTRSFAVKVRLPNADQRFQAGNVVTARIATGGAHTVLTVPPTAIQHYPDGALYVWVVNPTHQTVTRRIVGVGRTHGSGVEVVAGLQAGETVVTGNAGPLFDGMRVLLPAP
jgi:RND family efflux transporter MFP subunit